MSLVLSRKIGEALILYVRGLPPITVRVQGQNKFGDIRLCIDAHRDVGIVRDELLGEMADKTSRRRRGTDADDKEY
jgi:sRNA-binding carbon storage regulator CsrA